MKIKAISAPVDDWKALAIGSNLPWAAGKLALKILAACVLQGPIGSESFVGWNSEQFMVPQVATGSPQLPTSNYNVATATHHSSSNIYI